MSFSRCVRRPTDLFNSGVFIGSFFTLSDGHCNGRSSGHRQRSLHSTSYGEIVNNASTKSEVLIRLLFQSIRISLHPKHGPCHQRSPRVKLQRIPHKIPHRQILQAHWYQFVRNEEVAPLRRLDTNWRIDSFLLVYFAEFEHN